MVRRQNRTLVFLYVLTDALLAMLAFGLAYYLRFDSGLIPVTKGFPPVEQYRYNYGFLTPETYAWDMATVIAPMNGWDSIDLDGANLPEDPTPLGVGGLGYARFLIDDGPHYIASDSTKFGLEVYGYDCRVSYAYPGGLSLAAINPPPEG